MEIRKRIISVAILLTTLAAGAVYTSSHRVYTNNEAVEDVDNKNDDFNDMIMESETEANPFLAYNELLSGNEFILDKEDLIYLSTLRDDQNIVAVNSTVGHYNMISLDGDDAYVVVSKDTPRNPRVAEKLFDGEYYYDILTGMYASDGMSGIDDDTLTFGEYVERYGLEPEGICIPTFGKCEASEEALKTIEEVYGKDVADVIRIKGLPVPYYSYDSIYFPRSYDKDEDVPGPVKGLTY